MVEYIKQGDDYWIVKDAGYGNAIVIKSSWSSRYMEIAARYDVKIIRLNDRVGWNDSDISFLIEIPGLQGVDIISEKVTDVSPVFQLKSLKLLSLFCKAKVAGNFASLKNLQSVGLGWRAVYESLFALNNLRRINIIGYPDKDLTRWKQNGMLKELRLESNGLENLSGIEQFHDLKFLELFRCRKLNSIVEIGTLKAIQKVAIARCPGVMDLSPIAKLTELKEFEIEDCGKIQSLAPLAKCKKLKLLQIAGNTTILDGDFSFLEKLPDLKKVLLVQGNGGGS